MKIIETKVYTIDELSESAKEKAREWYMEGDDLHMAWEDVREDAKNIGLIIEVLDDHRKNTGHFLISAIECSNLILENHGAACETYKTAMEFIEAIDALPELPSEEDENYDKIERELCEQNDEIEEKFLHSLLEDYRIMLNKEVEYQNSNEHVDDMLRINEYEFTADGKRFA